jgi:hypothetical protein
MDRGTSNEVTSSPNTLAKKSRSGIWIVGGVATLVALLVVAGGALAVGRLSAPSREGEGDRAFGPRPEFQIEPAKELPTTTPSLRGIVTKRDGNTLSVGQRGSFGSGGNGSTTLVDVAVTSDTTIYHDTTQMSFNGQPPSGPVQQKVEPGTLDGINTNSRVTVWGDQNGNQLTAKVLVYTDPITFRQPQ